MFFSLVFTLLFFYLSFFIAKISRVNFFGCDAHPLVLFVIFQICIFSMPGVLMISFFGVESERYSSLSNDTLFEIGLWYLYSIFVLILVVFMSVRLFGLRQYEIGLGKSSFLEQYWNGCVFLTFFSACISALTFFLMDKPPIYYLISGDPITAYLVRVDMQTNPSKYYVPYVQFILYFFNVFQSYYSLYVFSKICEKKTHHYLVLFISILLSIVQLISDTQKGPVVYYLFGLLFIRYLYNPKFGRSLLFIVFIALVVIIFSASVMGLDFDIAINGIVDRVFLGQNQGFYSIMNYIRPDEKYWFQDLYFASSLGLDLNRADVDVLPYLYGDRDDVVNANSFFIGQAWSMFGYIGLIISPLIVGVCISLYLLVIDFLIKIDSIVFTPFLIYIVPSLPINQSFTYFLYSKYFLLNLVCVFSFYIIAKFVNKIRIVF